MNIAIGSEISEELASDIAMAVIAAEDCISPVSNAPSRKSTIICHQEGTPPVPPMALKTPSTALLILSSESISPIDEDITFIPINIRPRPCKIAPICLILSLLPIIDISTPTNATNANSAVIWNSAPVVEMAVTNAVTVVPMFAPITTGTACASVIRPTLTKPTIITVVAEELFTITVTAAPVATPRNRFLVALLINLRIDFPAAVSRFEPIIFIPIMNAATPPKSSSIQLTIVIASAPPSARRDTLIQ